MTLWGRCNALNKKTLISLKTRLKYIVGFAIIIFGLLLKITLNHNMNYWGLTKTSTIILLAIGLAMIFPFENERTIQKNKKTLNSKRRILKNTKSILFLGLLLIGIIGLEKIGKELNYYLRNYYLSHNTENTIGFVKGIKKIDIVKTGHAEFYMIEFNTTEKRILQGLMVDYAERDNSFFEKFKQPSFNGNEMTINNIKGNEINIKYSKKYPSFFQIDKRSD